MDKLELDVVGTLVVMALAMLSAFLLVLVDRGSNAAIFYAIVLALSSVAWGIVAIYWSERGK